MSDIELLGATNVHAFAVEILPHPFLFVGLLDVVVGLDLGIVVTSLESLQERTSTSTSTSPPAGSITEDSSKKETRLVLDRKVIAKVERGRIATSISTATVALVEHPAATSTSTPTGPIRLG